MMGRVWVNGAIRLRGRSGTVRIMDQWIAALSPSYDVREVQPGWARRSRSAIANAARDARWDFHNVARSCRAGDVILHPCNLGGAPRGVRSVVMVQDLMPLEMPELFDSNFVRYWRTLLPMTLRRADLVITTSEHVASKIEERWAFARTRCVYPPAIGAPIERPPIPTDGPLNVLVVGTSEPHKNQGVAIEAVAEARQMTGRDLRLRLVGPAGRAEADVEAQLRRVDPHSRWTRRLVDIPEARLRQEFSEAWCLLQPSLNEGFGLPLLEACQYGLPALHSGCGAMNEVMPSGNVGGTTAGHFTGALASLLDPQTWHQHSTHARVNYDRFSIVSFESASRAVMSQFLGAPDRERS